MDSILQKFRSKFIEEAHSLIDKLEHDLLELEKDSGNTELIESAFRAMHTIKGVSGMYGFGHISDYTHHMESIYQCIRDKTMNFDHDIFDVSFSSIDHIRKLLADENLENSDTAKIHENLLEKIQLILCNDSLQKAIHDDIKIEQDNIQIQNSTYNIILKATESLYFRGVSITDIFRDLASIGEFTIEKVPNFSNDDSEAWSIFFKTNATLNEIKETLMFIEDDCIIKKVGITNIIEKVNKNLKSGFTNNYETINLAVSNANDENNNEFEPEGEAVNPEDINISSANIDNTERISLKTSLLLQSEKNVIKRIAVDATKLDQLMFLVSELITVNSRLMRDATNPVFEPLWESIEKIDNLSKLFRNNAIEIRLVPLGDTILRFQRLIRDLSKHLNKKVELVTQGTEVELDKNTVDQLAEPLMHMIRNCIDHGIENPKQRLEKGKPETGQIKITANQSGNFIYITIEDDGLGIDVEKIRNKAIEKGFIKETDKLDKNELFDLIFLPGFSTAQNLTDVSGRGVGMDVVRKKIIDLRGEVFVESEVEAGTKFTLKIQQSLTILDTLLFKVENTFFTIPVSDIELCNDAIMEEIELGRHTSTLEFNNELISFVDLRKAMGIKGEYSDKTKEIIIKSNNKTFAVLADSIIGEHQAVLKPLGRAFSEQPLISSASQLGDGSMAFMLDVNILSKTIANLI